MRRRGQLLLGGAALALVSGAIIALKWEDGEKGVSRDDVQALASTYERVGQPVALVDGRELYVSGITTQAEGRVEFTFANGRRARIPTSIIAEDAQLPPVVDPAQFVVNPNAEYPQAEWMRIQPSGLAAVIGVQDRGLYVSDTVFSNLAPNRAGERIPNEAGPSLSDQRYFPDKRNFPNLLGALQRELPKRLSSRRITPNLGDAVQMAYALDHELTLDLAEARYRFATTSSLSREIRLLGRMYLVLGEYERLSFLIESRGQWVPPRDSEQLLVARSDQSTTWAEHQMAIWNGDLAHAATTLAALRSEEAKTKKNKRVEQAASRLKRLRGEPLETVLSHEQQKELAKSIAELRLDLAAENVPLVERWAYETDEEVLDELRLRVALFGRRSSPVVDLLLYLLEQREYEGTGVPVDILLWGGIHAQSLYGPERAAPIFAATQKTGGLLHDPDQPSGDSALQSKFAVEAAIYFLKAGKDTFPRDHKHPLARAVIDLANESYRISSNCQPGSGARNYHNYAAWVRSRAYLFFGPPQSQFYIDRDIAETSPEPRTKSEYLFRIADYHRRRGETEKAWRIYDKMWPDTTYSSYSRVHALRLQSYIAEHEPERKKLVTTNIEALMSEEPLPGDYGEELKKIYSSVKPVSQEGDS